MPSTLGRLIFLCLDFFAFLSENSGAGTMARRTEGWSSTFLSLCTAWHLSSPFESLFCDAGTIFAFHLCSSAWTVPGIQFASSNQLSEWMIQVKENSCSEMIGLWVLTYSIFVMFSELGFPHFCILSYICASLSWPLPSLLILGLESQINSDINIPQLTWTPTNSAKLSLWSLCPHSLKLCELYSEEAGGTLGFTSLY